MNKNLIKFFMKSAAYSYSELVDRAEKFKKINLPVKIELHLSNSNDIFSGKIKDLVINCKKLNKKYDTEFITHAVNQDGEHDYIFDFETEKLSDFEKTLEFTKNIGSNKLVLHRCYGLKKDYSYEYATKKFQERFFEFLQIAKKYKVKLLLENYGFIWLPYTYKENFFVSALDHFFPFEIRKFLKIFKQEKNNFEILIDIAHCILSCNMYNYYIANRNISKLEFKFFDTYIKREQQFKISPEDFILNDINYFHFSDAYIWNQKKNKRIEDYIYYNENYEIGKGNIDFKSIMKKIYFLNNKPKTLVMEIDPEDGNYNDNKAQYNSIIYLQKILKDFN